MARDYFMRTERTAFSRWQADDGPLAKLLWGDADVTRYICAAGRFTDAQIEARLHSEIDNQARFGIQYWPVFCADTEELIGCCGLRPHGDGWFELGFHLRPCFWRQGYAVEAADAVIRYAFDQLHAQGLFAGHNPFNVASAKVLARLEFVYTGDVFYPPTGLEHPSYERLPR